MRLLTCTALAATALLIAPAEARADVTSWLAVGGGATAQKDSTDGARSGAPVLTYSLGVGSSPLAPFVGGLLFRGTTMFGLGTDFGAALRGSTGGFARGDWGLALDAGAVFRYWRDGDYGRWPLQAVLTGGSPWGLQLALGAQLWGIDGGTTAEGFFAALEIDLLRLTVDRQGASERWWPNPNPAGGHLKTALAW